jgi:glyoxylase-like metal-dependent hydrolase (beta-lactamase superfamily II)
MSLNLPGIDSLFPASTPRSLAWFWAKYWLWFFLFLPWMLLRQIGIMFHQFCGALWTWNRDVQLLDGRLHIRFVNSLRTLVVTTVFGERFTCIQFDDILIDPGPVFAWRQLSRRLAGTRVSAIVATHAHEEHTGNALDAARITGAPVYGTDATLAAIREPELLSGPRRIFIGQPKPVGSAELRRLAPSLATVKGTLLSLESPGHCEGHASLFDEHEGVLFAGDSFLHTVFTAPNREVRGDDLIRTLERYMQLPIRTMVGTHGYIYSVDPGIGARPFLVRRRDPVELIRRKCEFLYWSREVVARGESRGLPYSVIEACLFPWQRFWSWQNWFTDEGGRLFSAGEFSRTHFVRSMSRHPGKVPPRFPLFVRLVRFLRGKRQTRAYASTAEPHD